MRLRPPSNQAVSHLTYCTNIHPGESLGEVRQALEQYVTAVKARVSPHEPFGVGLRLSNQAARELAPPHVLDELRAWLEQHGLYVFTINGFPYGAFHGTRVKERVYEPDWRSAERVHYSDRLANILCALLPDDMRGSISTVPLAWKAALVDQDASAHASAMTEQLLQHVARLVQIERSSGRTLALALEPEPGCVLETIAESVAFFEAWLFSTAARAQLAALTGSNESQAEASLHRHLGLCFDTCHAAVEFEDVSSALAALAHAGIEIKKLQLSAGLRVPRADARAVDALAAFSDEVYLHQTIARTSDGQLTRYEDLPAALAARARNVTAHDEEWRIHFHVPIFSERFDQTQNEQAQTAPVLESTQAFLREVLAHHARSPISDHLEVETYTWDVLPAALRNEPVSNAIARELEFVRAQLSANVARP